eukprot:scaffold5174_cov160-Amphora_coffeaeformis.AAC.1
MFHWTNSWTKSVVDCLEPPSGPCNAKFRRLAFVCDGMPTWTSLSSVQNEERVRMYCDQEDH